MNLEKFNHNQLEAITSDLGPILVVAGAGSGKTQVLTARFEYLIKHFNFSVNNVLAITFTNKAANEMKTRLINNLETKSIPWIGTFHSICLKILREDINVLNRDKNFNVIDDDDQLSIFKEAYTLFNLNSKDLPYKQIFHLLEKFQINKLTIEDLNNEEYWEFLKIKNLRDQINKTNIIKFYLNYCEKNNLLCFNDLLTLANKVLDNPEVLKKWQAIFQYVLVDEFQDTNDEQYSFIKKICKESQNIFAVGDPDQMIYTWRGANEAIINNFKNDFKNTKIIVLDINYRSNQETLDASNHLIKNNYNRVDKQLIAHQGYSKNKPIYFHANNQDQESHWVVEKIKELLNDKNINPNQIAILYRSNYLSRNIEQELITNHIKYKIFGSLKFYQRKEIKDILAYLKAVYFLDELSIKRIINIPRRGISQQNIDIISEYARNNHINFVNALFKIDEIPNVTKACISGVKKFNDFFINLNLNQPMAKVVDEILLKTDYYQYLKENEEEYRIENIKELIHSINDYEKTSKNPSFINYLQDVSLLSEQDDKETDAITLMTIHIAKGLEFDYVFIIGLNEDIFPTHQAIISNNIDEERRIAYVALTRAKKQLYLSSYDGINQMYNHQNIKSRFIDEISKNFYVQDFVKIKSLNKNLDDWYDTTKVISNKERIERYSNNYDFKIGDQVIHTAFGLGHVMKIENNILTIYFNEIKQKKDIQANHISIKRVLN